MREKDGTATPDVSRAVEISEESTPDGARAGRQSGRWARRLFVWLALLTPVLAFLPLVWRLGQYVAAAFAFPWQIDFDEGIVLRAAWLLARGRNPYPALQPDTFVSATYPPVYYILNAGWLALTGPTLLSGRVISVVAVGVIGLLLAWWARRESGSWLAGCLAMVLWLSLSPVAIWGPLFKPDMLALALTVAGLAWARRWPTWPALLGASLLFALAFFTKQSALVGPLAVGLWLLTGRGPWLRFGLVTGALLIVPFAAANLVLRGGLWLHLIVFQQLPWTPGQLVHNLEKLVETYPWLLVAAGLGLLWLATVGRGEEGASARPGRTLPLPVWYLLAAVPAIVVANGRVSVNYGLLLDLCPPLCLLASVAAGQALAQPGRWRPAAGLLIVGLLLTQAIIPNPPGIWYSANRMPTPGRADRMEGIARLVEQNPGPILSEDLWMLLREDRPVEYDDPFMMAQTAQRGLWDESRFVADLEAQRFPLVLLEYEITGVTRSPRWSPTALAALRANYEILYKDVVFVHRPKSLLRERGQARSVEFGGQVRLVETNINTSTTRPGGTVRVMLRWQRAATPTADYHLFIHLVDSDGGLRAQLDLPPSSKPTTAWAADERAEGEYALTVPADAPAGAYRVLVGLYDPTTGQRLPATEAGAATDDTALLAELTVVPAGN